MSFTKTSEGRVFFKNADNDDPIRDVQTSVKRPGTGPITGEPVMPKDNTQMQTLLLLKTLNASLKKAKSEREALKSEISTYQDKIKALEAKTEEQQNNYIDLEKNVSKKQSEASKKSTRLEDHLKKTLKQIADAKAIVKEIETKTGSFDTSLIALKDEIKEKMKEKSGQSEGVEKLRESHQKTALEIKKISEELKKRQDEIDHSHQSLVKAQKEQGEKMVNSLATYVDLTKRVGESESRQEALENKIEDARSDYLKLDRKIDKAIEDRNRILRKVERIENAVLETRDALNAKAMVLLTDQGAVSGVNLPQISDETLQNTDPLALQRRLEEEALMPWWRKPMRLDVSHIGLILCISIMVGWVSQSWFAPNKSNAVQQQIPVISAPSQFSEKVTQSQDTRAPLPMQKENDTTTSDTEIAQVAATEESYGIRIHKGYKQEEETAINDIQTVDINNDDEMLAILEENPEKLAQRLNTIEPGSLTAQDKVEAPAKTSENTLENIVPPAPPAKVSTPKVTTPTSSKKEKAQELAQKRLTKIQDEITQIKKDARDHNATYRTALLKRISPDPNLNEIAQKIEVQAFDGVPEAQHDLGALYVAGHGQVTQNLQRAVFWFTEAANNGVANAKYNLGVLYHQGLGVDQNIPRAIALYSEAADLGHAEAQYNLGIAYIEGIGVSYAPQKAAEYFTLAARQNVVEAAYNLGLIYENGLLGEVKPDEALLWYKSAADQGSPEANAALKQLANSLGIDIRDVNRIVEKLQREKSAENKTSYFSESTFSENQVISEIQSELMRLGLYPGPVDGMIGPMTQSAIESYQYEAGMSVTGKPTEALLSHLKQKTSSYYR